MRIFVRKHKVRHIRDLRSEMAHKLKDDLNSKFIHLGVYFEIVIIKNVVIPRDLRIALEQTTTYDVHL